MHLLCGTKFSTYTNRTFYFLTALNSVFGVFIRNHSLLFTNELCYA